MKTKLLSTLVGILALAAFAQAAPGSGKLSDRAREVLESHPGDWVNFIVTYDQRRQHASNQVDD